MLQVGRHLLLHKTWYVAYETRCTAEFSETSGTCVGDPCNSTHVGHQRLRLPKSASYEWPGGKSAARWRHAITVRRTSTHWITQETHNMLASEHNHRVSPVARGEACQATTGQLPVVSAACCVVVPLEDPADPMKGEASDVPIQCCDLQSTLVCNKKDSSNTAE